MCEFPSDRGIEIDIGHGLGGCVHIALIIGPQRDATSLNQNRQTHHLHAHTHLHICVLPNRHPIFYYIFFPHDLTLETGLGKTTGRTKFAAPRHFVTLIAKVGTTCACTILNMP